MPTVRSRACTDCGKQYDVTAFEEKDGSTVYFGLDDQMDDAPICPICEGMEYKSIVRAVRLKDLDGYPYFDAGAGREFASAKERRDWMKANNVQPLEGELENHQAKIRREQEAEAAQHDAVWNEMNRSVGSDPEYLNARDKGLAPVLGIQEAPKK